eukprot:TRINITY_DN58444_c0_g1_i1.p3 TRINITY_DN58444_c0_g1~~TRINITY_DN58444_c0_g1_i1.p3  ORF type:complete len:104 (+),score=6.31 TRINITY_DN58444_c0_g1_i1:408-719(+)
MSVGTVKGRRCTGEPPEVSAANIPYVDSVSRIVKLTDFVRIRFCKSSGFDVSRAPLMLDLRLNDNRRKRPFLKQCSCCWMLCVEFCNVVGVCSCQDLVELPKA